MKIQIEPTSNNVFIETFEEKITKSGIIIPDSANGTQPIKGVVLAVGPGKLDKEGNRIKMSVKAGDEIIFKKFGPDEIEIDDKKYLVGSEDDIIAVIKYIQDNAK